MKKVMLIQPWNYHDEGIANHDLSREWRNGPYSLLCLGTQLREQGVPVLIIDLQPVLVLNQGLVEFCLNYLQSEIVKFQPDIIGISFFSYQFIETKLIVEYIKNICCKNDISPLLMAGGIHASIEPRKTIEQLGFDYAFVGEGDLDLISLAMGESPAKVPGIVSLNDCGCKKGTEIVELDNLPFPDWNLCNYKFYSAPNYAKISGRLTSTLDLMMGRGCTYRCAFCAYSTLSSVRYYSAEYLVEQILFMKKNYEIDSVYFIDSSIGNNQKLLIQFCELLNKKGISRRFEWYANIRANQVNKSLLKLLWSAGCRSLFYGFESGSQKILDLMNKKCSVEDNYKTAELHNKLRFPYHASMILGYPGETEVDINHTFDFLRKVQPPFIGVNWYIPLPGSDDYEKLNNSGRIHTEDPHEWRRIGEVLSSGQVFADVEKDRFIELFKQAQDLAGNLKARNLVDWLKEKI